MKTYRVYALTVAVAAALAPTVAVAYVRAGKYGEAWATARSVLNGKAPEGVTLYSDVECKEPWTVPANTTCARIDDIRPRNVKLDKAALTEILADDSLTAEQKLDAMRAFTTEAPYTAPSLEAAPDGGAEPVEEVEAPAGRRSRGKGAAQPTA